MPFEFSKVLVLGATSGIGEALAIRMLENGVNVVAVGRRQEKLDSFAEEHGSKGKATVDTAAFDITKLQEIPKFAENVFAKHPDVDCVWLNSGLQRALNWADPDKVDLDKVELELLTNYTSYIHLSKAFLPYLQRQAPKKTSLIFTTSGLALVPILTCPNYCATKAALHHMILCMRQQLKDANSNVEIIELYPPAVQTELHDFEMGKEKGGQVGMPLADFVNEAWESLSSESHEQVPVQAVKTFMGFNSWEQERQKTAQLMWNSMKKSH